MKIKKIEATLLLILVYFMPFHSMFFALINLPIFVLWRDFLIFLLIGLIIQRGKVSLSTEGNLIALALIVCVIHAVLFHGDNNSAEIWLNTLRIYIESFLAFYIGKSCSVGPEFVRKVYKIYIKGAAVISIWGIFQMFVLGSQFLKDIGFGISSAVLANGFQRNVGVFASANLMGVYLVIAILLLLYGGVQIKAKSAYLYLMLISLILTFSTSAILGLICCIAYEILKKVGIRKTEKLHMKTFKAMFIGIIFIILAFVVDVVFLKGKIVGAIIGRVNELFFSLTQIDVSRSTSASIHLDDLIRAVDIVKQNFWGVGFSTSSFILLNRVPKSMLTNAVESSVFTILFDFGVIGGSIYLIPFMYPIIVGIKERKKKYVISDKIMITLIILYIFLPLVSSIELRFFAFLFLGFETNCRIKGMDNKRELQET